MFSLYDDSCKHIVISRFVGGNSGPAAGMENVD